MCASATVETVRSFCSGPRAGDRLLSIDLSATLDGARKLLNNKVMMRVPQCTKKRIQIYFSSLVSE
jgi:hypothetical protein